MITTGGAPNKVARSGGTSVSTVKRRLSSAPYTARRAGRSEP